MFKRNRLLVAAFAAVLVLSACGQVQEALLEEAVEQAAGEEIEFNLDDDGFTISNEEGEMRLGTGELPDGFDYELPDGYEVISGWRQDQTDETYFYVQVSYPGADFDKVVEMIGDQAWPADVQTSQTTGSYQSSSWVSIEADRAVTVTYADDLTFVAVNIGLS